MLKSVNEYGRLVSYGNKEKYGDKEFWLTLQKDYLEFRKTATKEQLDELKRMRLTLEVYNRNMVNVLYYTK